MINSKAFCYFDHCTCLLNIVILICGFGFVTILIFLNVILSLNMCEINVILILGGGGICNGGLGVAGDGSRFLCSCFFSLVSTFLKFSLCWA